MGNKPSHSDNHTSTAQIIREGPPPRERGRLTPDPSDSGVVLSDPRGSSGIDFSKNFSLRLQDSGLIGGKHVRGIPITAASPPSTDTNAFEDDPDELIRHLPRGFPDSPSPEDLDVYWDTVKQVTSIWPEYGNIRDVDIRSLKPSVRQTLQQILKRIFEQHELIRNLSNQNHDVKQELAELQEEREANQEQLARRDREIRMLREDVFLLRKELKKLSQEHKLPKQISAPEFQSDSSELGVTSSSWDAGSDDVDGDAERIHRLAKEGIYRATPLIIAERTSPDSRKPLTKTQSLRPTKGASARDGSGEVQAGAKSLKSKLRQLEGALEAERKTNEILRERLHSIKSETTVYSPAARLRRDRQVSLEEYAQRYRVLEAAALDKVAKCLYKQLSHTSNRRQQQFTCAVVQKSYDVALGRVRQFKDMLTALINNPANPEAYSDGSTCRPKGALAGQISLFEHFKPGYGINQMSPLAIKTQVARDIPEALIEEIYEFLESMADFTKITELIESVVDNLRQEYGDCTTAALLNKAEFSDFLYDCCRFAWQVCVIRQPLYVTSTQYWHYDERYHVTDSESIPTNAGIDYYIFPILFRKEKSAEVLHKGRVCIKT